MESSKYRYAAVIALVLFALYIPFLTVTELPFIAEGERPFFIAVKIWFALASLGCAYWLWRDYSSLWANVAVGVHCMIYTLHGQWYRPLYYFAFLQLSLAYSFLMDVPKRIFRPLVVIWMLAYVAVFRLKWEDYVHEMRNPIFSDIVFGVIAAAVMTFAVHTFLTSERMFRWRALARFSRLGYHSARLVHDLKGLTSAPKLYAQMLQRKLGGGADPETSEMLRSLSANLQNLERVLGELNRMTSVKFEQEITEFPFDDVLERVKGLLATRLKDVELEVNAPVVFKSDRSMLISMTLNLVLNSLDRFEEKGTANPRIQITWAGRELRFNDNAGGFEPAILRKIAAGVVPSTKISGSGIGLWMVIDGMDNIGGTALFSNENGGARVRLRFPRGAIV